MMPLIYGLITGILFGVFTQKALVLRYDKQVAALRLKDMTIVKFMFSSVLVAMVGVYLLRDLGLVELDIKALSLGGNILGGGLFGIGWALFGYCPGTAVGALAEGRWDSIWGIAGMLIGAMLFAELYPFLNSTVMAWGNWGKVTVPDAFHVNHWIVIVLFLLGGISFLYWLERKGL